MAEHKVGVVVGVGPGLGAAVARRFAAAGYAVGLMARGQEKLLPLQVEIESAGGRALSVPTDGTDPEAVSAGFARVRDQLGKPDVFVYNAGDFRVGGILEVTPDQFEASWKVNCLGAYLGAREVLPGMLEAGRGTILLTGATGSVRGGARFASLAVGKFGLRALAQSLAREFGPHGIHVAHVIIDGVIDTPRVRQMMPDRQPETLLSARAIAETYWQLHAQDRTSWTLEIDVRPAMETF